MPAEHIPNQNVQSLPQQQVQYQPAHGQIAAPLTTETTAPVAQLTQQNHAIETPLPSTESNTVTAVVPNDINQCADSPSSTTSLVDQIHESTPPAQVKAPPASAPASTVASKSRRSNKSTERIPKLVVMSVQNGTLVDCSMENKQKTITFKFDISDVNPVEVANDLVSNLFQLFQLILHGNDQWNYLIYFPFSISDIQRFVVQ